MNNSWTEERRKQLEFLLREDFSILEIAEVLGVSHATIYNELKKHLSVEEYSKKRFRKYSAERAMNKIGRASCRERVCDLV